MLDLMNQAQREKDGIIALYNPKRAIYGTNGIVFATGANGQVYRAIDTKANIGVGSVLTDTTKWLRVDLINGQNAYNKDLGAVKTGLEIIRGNDLKLSVEQGTIKTYDDTLMRYEGVNIPDSLNATFDYIDKSGVDIEVGVTEFDTDNWDDNGTKTTLNKSTRASFQKVYISTAGDLKVMRGTRQYASLARSSYEHIDEEIPSLQSVGLFYIGGLLITKNCDELGNTKRCRAIKASKLGESHVGGGGGNFSLLKAPQVDLTAIKAIEAPENGEMRQDLSKLPLLYYYCFNTGATTGEEADDGTTGRWNLFASAGNTGIEMYYERSYTSRNNAKITITPTRDIRVYVEYNITGWASGHGYVYSIATHAEGTAVQGINGSCQLYFTSNNEGAHCKLSTDLGIYDLTAGNTYTFKFGSPSTSMHCDNNDRSSILLMEVRKYV
jgi:hypothetical protein